MAALPESVRLEGISKRFDQVVAVDTLSLAVRRGEFVCLLGPSGCGKTTTLRMIAGFIEPDGGGIFINGRDVTARAPNKRDIGMVYQSYALFPHIRRDVYARPQSSFVDDFLGRANFLPGRVTGVGATPGSVTFTADGGEVLSVHDAGALAPGSAAQAFIRPERVGLRRAGEGAPENALRGEVEQVIFTGSVATIEVRTATGRQLVVERPSGGADEAYRPGDPVAVVLPPEALRLLAG